MNASVSFPLDVTGVSLPLGEVVRLAPYAAQALHSRNTGLLSGVLDRCEMPADLRPEAARQLAVGFAVSRLFHPTYVDLDPEASERTIQSLSDPANPLSQGGDRLFEGPLGEPPKFSTPQVPVYSDPDLAPAGETDIRVTRMHTRGISSFWLEGTVDMRDLCFSHTLSEGRASELVAEKVAQMQAGLRELLRTHSWETDAEEVIRRLTEGDKDSSNDRIRVGVLYGGVYQNFSPPYYVLNGHRRLAALSILTLMGEIPLEALTRIPVWVHEIKNEGVVKKITAEVTLDNQRVLAEVRVQGYVAAEALQLLRFYPRIEWQLRPLDPERIPIWSTTDSAALLHFQKAGRVAMSRRRLALLALQRMAKENRLIALGGERDLLGALFPDAEVEAELWRIVQSVELNGITAEVLQFLYRIDPVKVLSYVEGLLDGLVTARLLDYVNSFFQSIGAIRHQVALARFASHPDPAIRGQLLYYGIQDWPGGLRLLVGMHKAKINMGIQSAIEGRLAGLVSDAWEAIHRSPDGQVSPTSLQIFREEHEGDPTLWGAAASILRATLHYSDAASHAAEIAALLK